MILEHFMNGPVFEIPLFERSGSSGQFRLLECDFKRTPVVFHVILDAQLKASAGMSQKRQFLERFVHIEFEKHDEGTAFNTKCDQGRIENRSFLQPDEENHEIPNFHIIREVEKFLKSHSNLLQEWRLEWRMTSRKRFDTRKGILIEWSSIFWSFAKFFQKCACFKRTFSDYPNSCSALKNTWMQTLSFILVFELSEMSRNERFSFFSQDRYQQNEKCSSRRVKMTQINIPPTLFWWWRWTRHSSFLWPNHEMNVDFLFPTSNLMMRLQKWRFLKRDCRRLKIRTHPVWHRSHLTSTKASSRKWKILTRSPRSHQGKLLPSSEKAHRFWKMGKTEVQQTPEKETLRNAPKDWKPEIMNKNESDEFFKIIIKKSSYPKVLESFQFSNIIASSSATASGGALPIVSSAFKIAFNKEWRSFTKLRTYNSKAVFGLVLHGNWAKIAEIFDFPPLIFMSWRWNESAMNLEKWFFSILRHKSSNILWSTYQWSFEDRCQNIKGMRRK